MAGNYNSPAELAADLLKEGYTKLPCRSNPDLNCYQSPCGSVRWIICEKSEALLANTAALYLLDEDSNQPDDWFLVRVLTFSESVAA